MLMPLTPLLRCLNAWWNGLSWNPTTNPGGLANNGHSKNLASTSDNGGVCVVGDIAALAQQTAVAAQMASSCAAGNNGWTTLTGVVYARISATMFSATETGSDLTSFFKVNRSLTIIQTSSGFGVVTASSYDGVGVTTVTVGPTGRTGSITGIDAGLTQVLLGLDPDNAPLAEAVPPLDPAQLEYLLW